MMARLFTMILTAILLVAAPTVSLSQASGGDTGAVADRSATGGAQTLQDILRRQEGLKVDDSFRSDNIGGDAINTPEMAPLGGASDADLWRALRYNKADTQSSSVEPVSSVMIQSGGMTWLKFREGPLIKWGGYALLGMAALLLVFYLIRGRIRLDAPKTGRTLIRFRTFERLSHWLLAISFILQAVTGLVLLLGRWYIAPWLGKDFNAGLLSVGIFIHDTVAWGFIAGLVLVFVLWAVQNIPGPADVKWVLQGGGIFGKKHPPAPKFNGGQKVLFWLIILMGTSVTLSGLSLLFPYEMPLFGKTFGILNSLGIPGLLGMETLPVHMPPQEEMQLAQAWHAIVAFGMIAIILAHIYIGTVGMEGAFDAMGTGKVDEAWAEQHHSIWYEKVKNQQGRQADGASNPAE